MKKILKKSKGVSEKCSKSNNFCQHSHIPIIISILSNPH